MSLNVSDKKEQKANRANEREYTLYHRRTSYEEETVSAIKFDDEIHIFSITSEFAPGGQYGERYVLDPENTKKLMRLLPTRQNPCLWLKLLFSGKTGLARFEFFCRIMRIEYVEYGL